MKKILLAVVAFLCLCACNNGEPEDFFYRGLSLRMKSSALVDSLALRGFAVDSAASADTTGRVLVLKNPSERYRILIGQKNDTIQALQENYSLSTNDSTRQMWQQLRDNLEKETGAWPNCPMLKDDHKIAKFETEGGFITVTLKNTYTPTLQVLYEVKW